jgi:hypothetical protein
VYVIWFGFFKDIFSSNLGISVEFYGSKSAGGNPCKLTGVPTSTLPKHVAFLIGINNKKFG